MSFFNTILIVKNGLIRRFFYFIYCIRYNIIRSKRESRQVLNNFETIDYILKNGCSISRFGDGELDLVMAGKYRTKFNSGFQKMDIKLSERLRSILKYENPAFNHLVCLPACIFGYGSSYLKEDARFFWNKYAVRNIDRLLELTLSDKLYGETNISRLYLSHKDKSKCTEFVNNFRKLWDGRDVVLIEGAFTRLGYGNNLFSNVKSLKRILCPNVDAFDKYDLILESVLNNTNRNQLLIIALGMTATVLAYDLANKGRQALDLGHFDIEYEWMLMKATKKIAIPGKFTNEAKNGKIDRLDYPIEFKRQILLDIS